MVTAQAVEFKTVRDDCELQFPLRLRSGCYAILTLSEVFHANDMKLFDRWAERAALAEKADDDLIWGLMVFRCLNAPLKQIIPVQIVKSDWEHGIPPPQ